MATTKAAAAATKSLGGVNVPPAQTWNYLRINSIALEVEEPTSKGEVLARLPRVFDSVETGIGEEAASWAVASSRDSRYVEVKAGQRREEPIVVDLDAATTKALDTGVLVREGAEATVVVVAHGSAPAGTTAALVRIVAERGAHVTLVEVMALPDEASHLEGVGIKAADGATIEVRQYALGGGKLATGIATSLDGTGARLTHDMRFLVRKTSVLDANHVVRQRGRNTKADVHASGILADAAHKTLRETIDLVHGAKGAAGNELETVLVTGDEVVNKTLPTILCDEDDVAGNHGASIGSISPEQLAYLADRGLDAHAAEALFARAIFDDAVIHAPEAVSRAAALERAEEVLGADIARDVEEGLGLSATPDLEGTDA